MPKLRVVESGICDVWRGFERSVERFWFLFVGRVRRGFCALGGVGLGTAGFAGALHCCPDFPMCVAEGVAALGCVVPRCLVVVSQDLFRDLCRIRIGRNWRGAQ